MLHNDSPIRTFSLLPVALGLLAVAISLAPPAGAIDGVVEINQAAALAGGITAGDAAGFPVSLDVAGSYRLTGDLTSAATNTHLVEITADGVTLDLNGFALRGPSVCTGSGAAVSCAPVGSGSGISIESAHVLVQNGLVTGAAGGGVNIVGIFTAVQVEDVRVERNALYGIYHTIPAGPEPPIFGGPGRVERCTAVANGGPGIDTDASALLLDNVASQNSGAGILAGGGGIVRGNTTSENGGDGIFAFDDALVLGNNSFGNGAVGLRLTAGSGYADNTVRGNTGGTVAGGVQIGVNFCNDNTVCP